MPDDPLDGPGGVGYSWFRLEIVSTYVPVEGGIPGDAFTMALKYNRGQSGIFKAQAESGLARKIQRASSWIRKPR